MLRGKGVPPFVAPGLPMPRNSLVGREREVAELIELFRDRRDRLVTLTGVGGCGKTRLALEVAWLLRESFPDGVWLVDLTPLSEPHQVALRVAGALSVSDMSHTSLEPLQHRTLLLVLDNCEHLLDACAGLADQLLSACADVRILATSREPLLISGERQRRLPPLRGPEPGLEPTPDVLGDCPSVQLFIERASEVASGFELTAHNAAAVAQICTLLDGIPLALELAAAQARVLAPAAIAERLDDCIRLLTGGNRLAPTRQQTLRASLDWSYALLSPAEQVVFRRLAVLAGAWTIQAAEAVCAADDVPRADVLAHLTGLVDKSLVLPVERHGELLYRLLEPVRQYAAHRLAASGELESTQVRLSTHCSQVAEFAEVELTGRAQGDWLRTVELELDSIRAVLSRAERDRDGATILRIANPLYYFLWLRRHLREGRHWFEAGLARGEDLPRELRARGLFGLMLMLSLVGENVQADAVGQQAVTAFRALGDSRSLALVMVILAQLALTRGDARDARDLAEDAVTHARGSESAWPLGHALILLGHVVRRHAETARALELYQEAQLLFEGMGDAWARAFARASIASLREPGSSVARVAALAGVRWSWDVRDLPGLASALEYLALYGGPQPIETQVRLCAAAHALRSYLGVPAPPGERDEIERQLRQARAQLGDAAFQSTWEAAGDVPTEQLVRDVLGHPQPGPHRGVRPGRGAALTPREREVALLLVEGATDRQIAQALTITEGTAGLHVHHVLAKLGLRSRAQVGIGKI